MNNKEETGVIEPFKVFIRIRPMNEREQEHSEKQLSRKKIKNYLIAEDNLLFVLDPESLDLNVILNLNLFFKGKKERSFAFDSIFDNSTNNQEIFNNVVKKINIKTILDKRYD